MTIREFADLCLAVLYCGLAAVVAWWLAQPADGGPDDWVL